MKFATSKRGSKSRRARRRGTFQAALGIEVDGSRVTGVVLRDQGAGAAVHGTGATLRERIESVAKAAGRVDTIHVTVVDSSTVNVMATVTPDLAARTRFTRFAHEKTATSAHTHAVAGVFDPNSLHSPTRALVTATPRALLDEVHAALGGAARVAAPGAAAHLIDGLSLALRDSAAELTLVTDTVPAATATLPAGGLAALEHQLGQGVTVGTTRLGAALRSRHQDLLRQDPPAAALLTTYLRLVATQVRSQVTAWELEGHNVPTNVYAHGRGATAAALPGLLRDVGLTKIGNGTLDPALTFADPIDRPELVTAYLAARRSQDPLPAAAYPNPTAVEQAHKAARRTVVARRRATLAAAATLTLAGPVVALTPAAWAQFHAVKALDAAVASAADRLGTTREALTAATASGTVPPLHAAHVAASLPDIETIGMTVNAGTVTLVVRSVNPVLTLAAVNDAVQPEATVVATKSDAQTLTITLRGAR